MRGVLFRRNRPDYDRNRRYWLRRCCPHLIEAMALLDSVHGSSSRPKLTHHWLAEQLHVTRSVSWSLMEILAAMNYRCCHAYAANTPVFWDNDPDLQKFRLDIATEIEERKGKKDAMGSSK